MDAAAGPRSSVGGMELIAHRLVDSALGDFAPNRTMAPADRSAGQPRARRAGAHRRDRRALGRLGAGLPAARRGPVGQPAPPAAAAAAPDGAELAPLAALLRAALRAAADRG